MKEYDVVVIGAGPGGYETALELGRGGMRTLLIDKSRDRIGGTCLNEGCVPAKLYLECAEYASRAAYFTGCGLDAGTAKLDLEKLKERKTALIELEHLLAGDDPFPINGEVRYPPEHRSRCNDAVAKPDSLPR